MIMNNNLKSDPIIANKNYGLKRFYLSYYHEKTHDHRVSEIGLVVCRKKKGFWERKREKTKLRGRGG